MTNPRRAPARLRRSSRRTSLPLAAVLLAAGLIPLSHGLHATEAAAQDTAPREERIRSAISALEFREIGPTIMGGRISDLAVVESDPRIFYVGVATGGVWKTENAGVTFEPVFDDQPTASIGDVTLAPSNPNVVWVGTGEPQNRQSSPWGDGVYRSTDAGRTWTHLGLSDTHHIGRIQVHPADPDVAYVAAVGHLWGSNPERGVYRTTDGGESWEKVLYVDEHTGAIDLAMDPGDPNTLFAAMYQRQRKAWGFNGGGPGSGLYRTMDGGDSWTELTEGLPPGDKGRIGVDIYRGNTDLVYAIVEADPRVPGRRGGDDGPERNGVYRSDDRGETWEQVSTTNNRPMYYSQIRIDPNDPERIYLGGARLYMSEDGGRTFTDEAAAEVHLDHHALWIDPSDSNHLILGSDGGVSVSRDRSENWYQFRNLPLAQFYEIGVDMREPYHVCGGLQDNGSWCGPSDTWSNQGIRTKDWYNVGGGDGFFTVMHPDDPDLMFAESQGGNIARVDRGTMERAGIRPSARPGMAGTSPSAEEGPDLRWNWNTPILQSSHDPNTVYAGSNVLFRSRDLGRSWEAASPDLTYAVDREELEIMGVRGSEPQMSLNDGQSTYGNLTALAESPLDAGVLYTGADDGRLHVTRDGGATWTDVTDHVPGLPANTYVTRIVASRAAPGQVYAAFDGHRNDDFAPHVYVSDDYGGSWRAIVDGLPRTSVNALAQHPRNHDLLFVGNEVGAYVSVDGGRQWVRLENGLPTVPVDDIAIHPRENDLVIGTHGRGIWILDDIAPLEHLGEETLAADLRLFPVRPALSYNLYTPQGWTPGIWAADNPESGARIRYYVSEDAARPGGSGGASGDAAGPASLEIRDASGRVVRELRGPAEAGLNEIHWDLRLTEDMPDGEPIDPGPRVLPGGYTAALTLDGRTEETSVEVRLDPRVTISRAELEDRQDAMLASYRLSGYADRAEDALEELGILLDGVDEVLADAADSPSALEGDAGALRETVDELEEALDDAADGAGAWGSIQRATAPPTADQRWEIERSRERLPGVIRRINSVIDGPLAELLERVYQPGARPESPARVPVPGGA